MVGSIHINLGAPGTSDGFNITKSGTGGSQALHVSSRQRLTAPRFTLPSHKSRGLTSQDHMIPWGKKGSGTDDCLRRQCCSAPLPHKIASFANTPRIKQESGPYYYSATATTSRQVELYTSSWEHRGHPTDSPFTKLVTGEILDLHVSLYQRLTDTRLTSSLHRSCRCPFSSSSCLTLHWG